MRGFRAYGATEQTLNLPADIAVVWGPNSKGKTSLAEAVEFLLTGRTVRRELLASSQDEFADALRNAHLRDDATVYVCARIIGTDGASHTVKRTLTQDYGKKHGCASRLEVDGVLADESRLATLGLTLSHPPLDAPVLAQHTLSYIFSIKPQDRATYFKTLLELTDLDNLRNDVAALASELQAAPPAVIAKLEACIRIPLLSAELGKLLTDLPDATELQARLENGARALLEKAEQPVPDAFDAKLAALSTALDAKRTKTFPLGSFDRQAPAEWSPPGDEAWACIQTYNDELEKVATETTRLVALFEAALRIPDVAALAQPIECPLCSVKGALTPARVNLIRQNVQKVASFTAAKNQASSTLSQMGALSKRMETAASAAVPPHLREARAKRRNDGFSVGRIGELLGDRAGALVAPWMRTIRPLKRAAQALTREAKAVSALVQQQATQQATGLDLQRLKDGFAGLQLQKNTFVASLKAHAAHADALRNALREVVDVKSDTAGWQAYLDLVAAFSELRPALVDRVARASVAKELEEAVRQIDRAKEQVLDDKFADYSDHVQAWWNRLRPDEPTFFSSVQPRRHAKRTIDFKAGLSPNPDRSAPKVRDVIAVFSQSQLHCLGLALFLARAQHEGFGFIVLDDPVLTSDDDCRVHFHTTVLEELHRIPMQVIVLTQDHDTWEELDMRYRHLNIATAKLLVETSAEGSVIENTSDVLLAKIIRARSLARSGHPDNRKECGIHLRDAGERFCKELLVKHEHSKGNTTATLTDYDGKVLEWLFPHVATLLDRDKSHQGKFEAFRKTVNNASHDNAPPSTGDMVHACGEIEHFVKTYLGR